MKNLTSLPLLKPPCILSLVALCTQSFPALAVFYPNGKITLNGTNPIPVLDREKINGRRPKAHTLLAGDTIRNWNSRGLVLIQQIQVKPHKRALVTTRIPIPVALRGDYRNFSVAGSQIGQPVDIRLATGDDQFVSHTTYDYFTSCDYSSYVDEQGITHVIPGQYEVWGEQDNYHHLEDLFFTDPSTSVELGHWEGDISVSVVTSGGQSNCAPI